MANLDSMSPPNSKRRREQEMVEGHPYDAFLVHSTADHAYVMEKLLPPLETTYGLRVFIMSRDKKAWLSDDENLDQALRSCPTVVPLITPHFLESRNCGIVSTRARRRHEDGQSILAPVKLTDCATPQPLKGLPKLNLFEESARPYFFDHLNQMIRDGCTRISGHRGQHADASVTFPAKRPCAVTPPNVDMSESHEPSPCDLSSPAGSLPAIHSGGSSPADNYGQSSHPSPASHPLTPALASLVAARTGSDSSAAGTPGHHCDDGTTDGSPRDKDVSPSMEACSDADDAQGEPSAPFPATEVPEDLHGDEAAGAFRLQSPHHDLHLPPDVHASIPPLSHEEDNFNPKLQEDGPLSSGSSGIEIDSASPTRTLCRRDSDEQNGGNGVHPDNSAEKVVPGMNQAQYHVREARSGLPGKRLICWISFINWVTSVQIKQAAKIVNFFKPFNVLDLCCGQTDVMYWKEHPIGHLVGTDNDQRIIARCVDRAARQDFSYEFYRASCASENLQTYFRLGADFPFHVSTCQLGLHLLFESKGRARQALKNACQNLKPGGVFIGSVPDADALMYRLSQADGVSFGNDVYKVTFDAPFSAVRRKPLVGVSYQLSLMGGSETSEYLVYFPLLVKMLEDMGMRLLWKKRYHDFYEKEKDQYWDECLVLLHTEANRDDHITGPISTAEWELIGLYSCFCFQKMECP